MASLHRVVSLSKDRRELLFKLVVVLQALVITPLLAGLGVWQLERREQKAQLLDDWHQPRALKALGDSGLARYDRVQLSGQLDRQRWFLLDNQIRNGVVGYEVIGVLHPAGEESAVLITLGWVKAPADRAQLPQVRIPAQLSQRSARLDRPSVGLQLAESGWRERWPERVQQLELERLAQRLMLPLQPWLLRPEQDVLSGETALWQPVVMPPERHLGYAVQWFGLALAWLVMSGWLLHVMTDRRNEA